MKSRERCFEIEGRTCKYVAHLMVSISNHLVYAMILVVRLLSFFPLASSVGECYYSLVSDSVTSAPCKFTLNITPRIGSVSC